MVAWVQLQKKKSNGRDARGAWHQEELTGAVNRQSKSKIIFFYFVRWDFGYCGHYWPIVPAPDDR
jgi:hypothetical protein